jgi:hypothetical protein
VTDSNLVKVDFIMHCEVLIDAGPEAAETAARTPI